MRTIWRTIVRVLFWSYERGTWQYDLAVAGIVVFVLFSPLIIHYTDQPSVGPPPAQALVELRAVAPGQIATYRVDDLNRKAGSGLVVSAEVILALIDQWGQKLIDQVTVGAVQLDQVEASFARPAGAGRECLDHLVDLRRAQRVRSLPGIVERRSR